MNRQTIPGMDRAVNIAREWLLDFKSMTEIQNDDDVVGAIRAVLQALRDRLPVNEAADFGAQLPLIIRGIYFENWKPADKPLKLRTKKEFLEYVERLLTRNLDAEKTTARVFYFLQKKISQGEIADIKRNMPKDILALWPETEQHQKAKSMENLETW